MKVTMQLQMQLNQILLSYYDNYLCFIERDMHVVMTSWFKEAGRDKNQ